jgi:hypothetical protein
MPVAVVEVTSAASSGAPSYSVAGDIDVGALLESVGAGNLRPYMRAEVVLISSPDRTAAPSLSSMETRFDCVDCG